jgi:catechol 2,3-dioxygenase-like lactoylglutathione lyase family enzyme
MHRSRIGVVLIDQPEDVHDRSRDFWGGVLGVTPEVEADNEYSHLGRLGGSVLLEIQRTGAGTPARIHLDIETDDVPAEVARVTALGASVAEERDGYTIMRDPAGGLFCVVPVQTADEFDKHAVTWE